MKQLLTSAGITNPTLAKALAELVGVPAQESPLVFVPTAANPLPDGKEWLIRNYDELVALGYPTDIIDVAAVPKEMWLPRLEAAKVIVIGGGNTFYLLEQVRKSGLESELPRLLKDRVYMGISAGSIITGPSLMVSTMREYYPEDIGMDTLALRHNPFHIRPHLNSPHFPKVREQILRQNFADLGEPLYAIDDQSAIKIDGDSVEVVSEGETVTI